MAEIKIATVIPIGDGIFKESLTYFTLKDIKPGSLVFVPVRKRRIPAILLSMKQVSDVKSEIKNSSFELKKIEKATDEEFFSEEFMKTTEETANYFGTNMGQVINSFIPNNFLKGYEKYTKPNIKNPEASKSEHERKYFLELTQAPLEDRIAFYKSLIREEFAKKNSIFLCLPTIHEINIFSENLKKGIEEYTIILKPEDTPKKIFNSWQDLQNPEHPLLIIATPIFLCFINKHFGTIVFEKESSPAYKNISRPFIDSRYFTEKLAQKYLLRLILGDTVLRLETLHKKEEGVYNPSLLYKYRLINRAKNIFVNMKEEKTSDVRAIGKELIELIQDSIEDRKNIILLSTRKGLATSTVCSDCKTIVVCKKCKGTVVLHKGKDINMFSCHKCGNYYESKILCQRCRSWNLRTIGFGTERVEEEVKEKFPQALVFRMDGETVKTHKQGKEIMEEFLKHKGSILIGTELAIFYLTKQVENIAIVSADSLLFIPDFKIQERLFNYLVGVKLSTENNFLIQTRCPDNPIFERVIRGDVLQFYKEEILSRKNFSYPPFKLFIKITGEGKETETENEFEELAVFLKKWNPDKFRSSSKLPNEKIRMNLLIKIDPEKWPDKTSGNTDKQEKMPLSEILKILPPRFVVKVDAESIL
ncbi:MAG: hypothetical protein WCO84_00470 [bacterium]